MTPYVMISKGNATGINLQNNLNTVFAKRPFCFFAKGPYVLE